MGIDEKMPQNAKYGVLRGMAGKQSGVIYCQSRKVMTVAVSDWR